MAENTSTFVGNLTSDPELRFTQTGIAVANFTIAVQERRFDKTKNEYVDGEALFMRASVWREFAENVAGSLHKGTRVIATGRLKQRSYETTAGEKRTSVELEVDSIGPDLRYATATVTRAHQSGGNSSPRGAQGQPQQEEPWAKTSPGSTAATDAWNTPGGYSDESPF